MQYLYNAKRKGTAAHIWVGGDTACKMLSTGGIRLGKKEIHEEVDHRRICTMCSSVFFVKPAPQGQQGET